MTRRFVQIRRPESAGVTLLRSRPRRHTYLRWIERESTLTSTRVERPSPLVVSESEECAQSGNLVTARRCVEDQLASQGVLLGVEHGCVADAAGAPNWTRGAVALAHDNLQLS